MNNENNNDIIFDNNSNNINNVPLDNSTVDYNKLYNVNNDNVTLNTQQQVYQNGTTSQGIIGQSVQNNNMAVGINNQPLPVEDQIINPEVTPLEQNNVNEDTEPEKKKSFIFVVIIALIIFIAVIFLFPIIFKKGF